MADVDLKEPDFILPDTLRVMADHIITQDHTNFVYGLCFKRAADTIEHLGNELQSYEDDLYGAYDRIDDLEKQVARLSKKPKKSG
jgi:hypothetical protein